MVVFGKGRFPGGANVSTGHRERDSSAGRLKNVGGEKTVTGKPEPARPMARLCDTNAVE